MRKRVNKRKLLYTLSDRQGCGNYRCMLPAWYLQLNTDIYHIVCATELQIADMYCYDMIIFQRHFEDKVKPLWNAAKESGAIVGYETDDDFFNVRPINPAYKFIDNNAKQNVRNFMKSADAVIVSTEFLKNQMKCYNRNIYCIPNMIELDKNFIAQRPYNVDKEIRIVYAGGPSHIDDFKGVEGAIIKLLDTFGDKIKLFFMGWIPAGLKDDTRIKYIPWLPVKDYLQTLVSIQPHIGIVPLEHNIFNKSKSNIKWLEYTAVGAVTVASNSVPYQEVITNGVNGILVEEQRPRDWYNAISGLIHAPGNIRSMVMEAMNTIEKKQLNIITSTLLPETMDVIFNNVYARRNSKKG